MTKKRNASVDCPPTQKLGNVDARSKSAGRSKIKNHLTAKTTAQSALKKFYVDWRYYESSNYKTDVVLNLDTSLSFYQPASEQETTSAKVAKLIRQFTESGHA